VRVTRLRITAMDSGDDRGAVLVIVVIWMWLALLPMFVVFVVDVGNWFVHKRHLQLQADAGALAGGGLFTFPCSDAPIVAEARKYAGDPSSAGPYNLQVAPTDQANVHVLVNSSLYWNEGGTDYSDGGPPCSTSFIDVKITESTLPWFFGLGVVPAINAHARVEIQALNRALGALPVAVPDIDPRVARAYFIDEANGGTVIASVPLIKTGSSNGMAVWDNVAAPVSVPINSSRIGVRIALGGATSTTCGEELVECYDMGSSNGILFIRGWSSSGSGAPPNPPLARSVTLFPGSCSDPYFVASAAACSVGVAATVDFGGTPTTQVKVSAVVGGVEKQLQYDATSGMWISTSGASSYFTVNPSAGPLPVELKWEVNAPVTIGGNNCTTTGGNKCKGSFGTVQRVFSALPDRSGPVRLAQVWEGGGAGANSFQTGTTHDLVVKIAIQGNLEEAQSVSDPIVLLRVTGGSQNQSLDCDPDLPNLRDEIAQGCAPAYEINTGDDCPDGHAALWATAQPWDCVAIQTGGAVGQLEQGMKERILGGASSCTSPNNWSSFPNIPPEDPRIVPVFVTPFGTFTGSGNDVVPVTKFATFYVTGWFSSPCSGDDPVPDKGYVVGHFIKYVYVLNNGGGSGQLCNFSSFGSCIAVLTE
jgi:putative Flp pilus-assembly TadE/G-like protein